ncbi:MAG: flagellar filament capping protein FliD [Leptothrix sp. (in: b-proteobacteria)]
MAAVSSAGIGSGLDVNSIVTQLMAVEKAPLQTLQKNASTIQSKISSYGTIQSDLSAMRDAALKLTQPATWGDTTAVSGDTSVVSATTDNTATAGNYSLTVQQLASAQTLASHAWPATVSTVGAGTLRIEMGTWNSDQTGFAPKSASSAVDVSVLATDSLADVRDKINAAKAGVMASIVNDASGSRLVMRSSDTGAANGFRVSATDEDGNNTDASGLSALAYDPSSQVSSMSQTQAAKDAKATVNGLSVTSASNVLANVVDGVTLKLAKVSSAPVDLAINSNTDSITTAITAFTTAYNNLSKYLASQTAYDAATKTAGTLQGDAGTTALRGAMRAIAGDTGGMTGTLHRLADIGIQPQTDGSLSVDSTKLGNALSSKLSDVKALFANKDLTTDTNNGFATRFMHWGDNLLNSNGTITTRTDSLRRQVADNTKQQSDFNDRMTLVEARMRAQYTALDTQMASLNSLSSYVTQQITTMNKSTG